MYVFRSDGNTTTNYSFIDLSENRLQALNNRSFRNLRVSSIKIWRNRRPLNIDGRALRPLKGILTHITMRFKCLLICHQGTGVIRYYSVTIWFTFPIVLMSFNAQILAHKCPKYKTITPLPLPCCQQAGYGLREYFLVSY